MSKIQFDPSDPSVIALINGARAADLTAGLTEKGYQQLACATAATLTVPTGATLALIQPEGANVRWRNDGTNPTAAIGMRLFADEMLAYTGTLATIAFIQETATAKLNVLYYG